MPNFTILHKINSEISSNRLMIAESPVNSELELRELLLVVDLNSIAEVPAYTEDSFLTDDQKNALFWKVALNSKSKKVITWLGKRGNDPLRLIDFFVFNRQPYYVENLLSRYTGLSTLRLEPNTQLYLSIENSNSGLLGEGDILTVWGQAEIF